MSAKSPATMMPGQYTPTMPATPEIQHIANQVKLEFERRAHKICVIFTAIKYRFQVVAGTNYLIKVQISDVEYAHLKVFQSLPQENQGPILVDFQTGKTKDDPLEIF